MKGNYRQIIILYTFRKVYLFIVFQNERIDTVSCAFIKLLIKLHINKEREKEFKLRLLIISK